MATEVATGNNDSDGEDPGIYTIEPGDIICPGRTMVYTEHAAEVSCMELFGSGDWDDGDFQNLDLDVDEGNIKLPAGWKISGWQEHAHKDALGIVTFWLEGGKCDYPDCPDRDDD